VKVEQEQAEEPGIEGKIRQGTERVQAKSLNALVPTFRSSCSPDLPLVVQEFQIGGTSIQNGHSWRMTLEFSAMPSVGAISGCAIGGTIIAVKD
jgi:hypothetical protein